MPIEVSDKIANNAAENGKLIGKTTPSEETDYSYWKVFIFDGKIIACAYDSGDYGLTYGEEITIKEIPSYVDNVEDALSLCLIASIDDQCKGCHQLVNYEDAAKSIGQFIINKTIGD